jgi:hypothetical protein
VRVHDCGNVPVDTANTEPDINPCKDLSFVQIPEGRFQRVGPVDHVKNALRNEETAEI